MTSVIFSMFMHVSGLAGSGHHLPLPYVASSRAAIVVSSSASFGSDGVASISASFRRFICRRTSAGRSTLSKRVEAFASRATSSLNAWFARATMASVSSVM